MVILSITLVVVFLISILAIHSHIEAKNERLRQGQDYDRRAISTTVDAVYTGLTALERKAQTLAAIQTAETAAQAAQAAQAKATLEAAAADDPRAAKVAAQKQEPRAEAIATAPALGHGRQMTVQATAYCQGTTTADGTAVAWGVVAVDPSVIALGRSLYIPGYGAAVAHDTGGAVRGNIIDLYMPSCSEAIQWGRRTVTVTIY